MREILFRGKPLGDLHGKFIYGSLGVLDTGLCAIYHCFGFKDDEMELVYINTVGQYTGLTDKNGRKIFEGDIVTTDINRPYLIVEFRDGCFMFNCNDGGKDYYDIMLPITEEPHTEYKYGEVIGNIYDNPELLEV